MRGAHLPILAFALAGCSSSSAYDWCTSSPQGNVCVLNPRACCGCNGNPPCDSLIGDDGGSGTDAADDATVANDSSVDGTLPTDSGTDGMDADVAPDAPPCTCVQPPDLSNVGLGDFTIAFDLTTTMHPTVPGYGAIVNQRKTCDAQNPGWDVYLNSGSVDGTITVQVYDGSNIFDNQQSARAVNDGQSHRVVVTRSAAGTTITIGIDGSVNTFSGQAAENLTGTLAALQTGTEPICSGNMAAPSESLVGTVSNLCVAKTAGCAPP